MVNKPLWIGVPVSVLVSAAIAYALVYRTPLFKNEGGWISAGYTDFSSSFTPGYDSTFPPDVTDLKKLQPAEFQGMVQGLFDELMKLSEPQLYMCTIGTPTSL